MRVLDRFRAAILIASLAPAPAAADPEVAKQLAAEATQLASSNQMTAAASKFRAAYAEDPRPEYVCNVGVAYLKAADLPRAQRYLNDCTQLGNSLAESFRANVRKVTATVEAKLVAGDFTPVDLFVDPATATIAVTGDVPFDEPIVGSRRAWFPYGTYALTIHAEGYEDARIELVAASHTAVRVTTRLERPVAKVVPIEPPAGPAVTSPAPVMPPAPPVSTAPPVTAPVAPPSRFPAMGATVATGLVGVVAGALYLKARGQVVLAEGPGLSDEEFDDLSRSAKSYQHASWAVAGLAGAGAIVTGILWYRATRSSTPLEVRATASGATVHIGGQF